MSNICPRCGIQNNQNSPFCTNCGARLVETLSDFREITESTEVEEFENQIADTKNEPEIKNTSPINNQNTDYFNYDQQPTYYTQKNKPKPIIALCVIAIAAIVVLASFFIFFMGEEDEGKYTELDSIIDSISAKIDGGPSLNVQSLSSGNFQTMPAENCVAKYYLYYNNDKIGETYEANAGTTTFDGKNCYKVLGRADISLNYQSNNIAFVMDYTYYVEKNSATPVYMNTDVEYTEPKEARGYKMNIIIDWDKETSIITSKTTLLANSVTATSYLPSEYWGIISTYDELYVGFNEVIDYEMESDGAEYDVRMTMGIYQEQDVVVPAGTFEDCMVLEIDQNIAGSYSSSLDTNMQAWIDPDGNIPKASFSIQSINIVQELEGYYTTI